MSCNVGKISSTLTGMRLGKLPDYDISWFDAAGTLADADIEIVLTGDEEDAGSPQSLSRAELVAAGKRAEVALDFEAWAPRTRPVWTRRSPSAKAIRQWRRPKATRPRWLLSMP